MMSYKFFLNCQRLFIVVVLLFAFNSGVANSQTPPASGNVEGCDPAVMDALKAKSEAKVAMM